MSMGIRNRGMRGRVSSLELGRWKELMLEAVGYGPNYHRGPTMGEKIKGEFEIVEGKVRSALRSLGGSQT